MKTSLRSVHVAVTIAFLSSFLLSAMNVSAAATAAARERTVPTAVPPAKTSSPGSSLTQDKSAKQTTPGVELAQAITMITGVAISPLLGVSSVGAWKWWRTAPEARVDLPWYAQPWFWVSGLVLVALAFVKDSFGTALPTAMKKPFDVVETIENKVSGLVAAGAFVPLIAAVFAAADESAAYPATGMAMIEFTPLLNLLAVPLAIGAFLVVWMVSHVIHVLILISPFTTVDAALKSTRLFVLSALTATSFANPYAGAALSLAIILVCFLLAGWSFRLMVFGSVFTWDIVTFRSGRFKVEQEPNWVFTARAIDKTPIRTLGQVTRNSQGELTLRYRPWPWLWLAPRTLTLPAGSYAVGRGLFYSEIIEGQGEQTTPALTLLPRHRKHEEEFSSKYLLGGVQEVGVIKGLRQFWSWLKELCGFRPRAARIG